MSAVYRYAVPIQAWVPDDLPAPDSYSACSAEAEGWYAVIAVHDDEIGEAVVEDVRRSGWDVPDGVIDWRRDENSHEGEGARG